VGIDERHRIALHEAAKQTWGPEVAVTLMEMLPASGWAEVATKADLRSLANELTASFERALRIQMMWTVTTMIAGFGVIAAVMGTVIALTG
jgi:flagellar motor component MotA